MEDDEDTRQLSIYRAARTIKRRDNTLYNALRSIYDDSVFVGEIFQLWPDLPLLANLRCGLWYSRTFHATCYFKSTDGHNNNWSFNTSRLNLHVAQLAGQKGGCFIVDATRRGKRFPDSMSKTIPIWTCVLNRSIQNHRERMRQSALVNDGLSLENHKESSTCDEYYGDTRQMPIDWDCSLHLPLWVSGTERASIEKRLEEWTQQLDASGADISSLASCLKKPLRPLWISQKTVIWLNEVPDHESWDFTPIILVSASSPSGVVQRRIGSEFSWNYIPGAGDDEESWARGLTPSLFWNCAYDIINAGPEMCNQMVADIVEKDRVYRARRGQDAPQVTVKAPNLLPSSDHRLRDNDESQLAGRGVGDDEESWARGLTPSLFWNCAYDIINAGPEMCNQMVADIVEKDRVYRARRGQDAPQVTVKAPNLLPSSDHRLRDNDESQLAVDLANFHIDRNSSDEDCVISWLGLTNLAVGTSQNAGVSKVDCILNCDKESISADPKAYLHLPMVTSKFDRFSLLNNLPSAVNFAKLNLSQGKTLLICCDNGEDISVCICLAILTALFDEEGTFDAGNFFSDTCITKLEMRRRLITICKYVVNARPSRGNLKQVFNFLSGGRAGSTNMPT